MFKTLQDAFGYKLQDVLHMSFESFQLLIKINSDSKKEKVADSIDKAFPFLF